MLSQTVNDSRVLLGGGWPEMVMAKEVDELARKTPGKKSLAIEAFSRALLAIPTIIADNAGLDSAELISQLRAAHQIEGCTAGIDVISGSVSTETKNWVAEIYSNKHQLRNATSQCMILPLFPFFSLGWVATRCTLAGISYKLFDLIIMFCVVFLY